MSSKAPQVHGSWIRVGSESDGSSQFVKRSHGRVPLRAVWQRDGKTVRSVRLRLAGVDRRSGSGELLDRYAVAKATYTIGSVRALSVACSLSWRGLAFVRVCDSASQDWRLWVRRPGDGTVELLETLAVGTHTRHAARQRRPMFELVATGGRTISVVSPEQSKLFDSFNLGDWEPAYDKSSRQGWAKAGRAMAWAAGAMAVAAITRSPGRAIIAAGACTAAASLLSDLITDWANSESKDPPPEPPDMWTPSYPPRDMSVPDPPPEPAPSAPEDEEGNDCDPDKNLCNDQLPRSASVDDESIGVEDTGIAGAGGGSNPRGAISIAMTASDESTDDPANHDA